MTRTAIRYEIVMPQDGETVVMLTDLRLSDAHELVRSFGHRASIRPVR